MSWSQQPWPQNFLHGNRGAQGRIPARNVSVAVLDVDSGRPLIRHNAGKAMNPASAMKLITTYAALEMLGPAHTWKTDTLADAAPVDGTLNGNLYLRGSGDPRLALGNSGCSCVQFLFAESPGYKGSGPRSGAFSLPPRPGAVRQRTAASLQRGEPMHC